MARRRQAAQEAAEPTTISETVDQVVADAQARAEDTSFDPAQLEQQAPAEQREKPVPIPRLGRPWVDRIVQPVKFAKSTLKDPDGREEIIYRFELPAGQTKPDDAVLDIMRAHKYWKDGGPNGLAPDAKEDHESYPTGLSFQNHPRGGKAWVIPNTKMGRTVADSIDRDLLELGARLDEGQSPG